MKGSLSLGRYAGIKVQVHWTFFLLIGWVVAIELGRGGTLTSILWNVGFICVLFLCVIFHEFGHALTARRYGINTRNVTLLPIGGVASLEDMPEDPAQEFMVAIAGPAVNMVIALLLYLVVPVEQYVTMSQDELETTMSTINAGNVLFYLMAANIMLVLFNFIPAFPMDGGRILRALLSMKIDRVKATQIASGIGQLIAFAFFFIGLFYNPILILIALFVFFGAQGENRMIQQISLLKGYKVREAMLTNVTIFDPDDTVEDVVDAILSGTEKNFIVADEYGIKGVLYQQELISSIKNVSTDTKVRELVSTDFHTVQADDELTEIYRKASQSSKGYFPVLNGSELTGAIDMENINEFILVRASLDY